MSAGIFGTVPDCGDIAVGVPRGESLVCPPSHLWSLPRISPKVPAVYRVGADRGICDRLTLRLFDAGVLTPVDVVEIERVVDRGLRLSGEMICQAALRRYLTKELEFGLLALDLDVEAEISGALSATISIRSIESATIGASLMRRCGWNQRAAAVVIQYLELSGRLAVPVFMPSDCHMTAIHMHWHGTDDYREFLDQMLQEDPEYLKAGIGEWIKPVDLFRHMPSWTVNTPVLVDFKDPLKNWRSRMDAELAEACDGLMSVAAALPSWHLLATQPGDSPGDIVEEMGDDNVESCYAAVVR